MISALMWRKFQGSRVAIYAGGEKIENGEVDFEICVNQHHLSKNTWGLFSAAAKPPEFMTEAPNLKLLAIPSAARYRDEYIGMAREMRHCDIIDWPRDTYIGTIPDSENSYADEFVNTLAKELRTSPLSGIIAVAWALQLPIRQLYLSGFIFYYDAQRKKCPVKRDSHLIRPQIEWLRKRFWYDARIQVCENTFNVLGEEPRTFTLRVATEQDKTKSEIWDWKEIEQVEVVE